MKVDPDSCNRLSLIRVPQGDLWPYRIPNVEAALRRELETGLELQRQGKLSEAEAIFGRSLATNPDSADSWHALGLVRHQQGDFQGAVHAISRAILLDASKSTFFNNYGAALQSLGRCADAITAYLAALRLRPDYFDATLNLLRALNQQLQWKAAYALAAAAVERWPSDLPLLTQAAFAAENAGQISEAITWLRNLLALVRNKAAMMPIPERASLLRKLAVFELARFDVPLALMLAV